MQGNSRLGAGKGVGRRSAFAVVGLFFLVVICSSGAAYGADHLVTGGTTNQLARSFFPADLTINMGDQVQWTRDPTLGLEDHSSSSGTCDPPPSFNCIFAPTGPGGVSWGGVFQGPGGFFPLVIFPQVTEFRTFHLAGDYPYFCAVHPNEMRGIIRVNKANSTTSFVRAGGTPSTSTFGQALTFNVTVTSQAPPGSQAVVGSPTGTVTITDNGTPVGSASLGSISNTQSTASVVVTALSVGSHTNLRAVYNFDNNFNTSTSGVIFPSPQTVNPATPTVSLTNPTNPSTFGQSVTFTARVSGPAAAPSAPTSNVTFRDGLTTLATVALSSSGQPAGQAIATHSVLNLAAGTHDIRADYVGDGNFNLVNNTALSPGQQVVNKATPAVSVVSNAPSGAFATQTVTFTVALSAPLGTPTGTVTFRDGGTPIPGDVALVAGVANKDVSNLTGGSHNISAVYNPGADPNFNTNTGNLNSNPQVIRDFSVSVNPSTLANGSGQTASYSGTLTSIAGYGPRTVNLTCVAGGTSPPGTCTPSPGSVSVPSGGTVNFSVNVSSSLAAPQSFSFAVRGQDAGLPALQRQQTVTFNVVDTKVNLQTTANHGGNPEPVHVGEVVQLNTSVRNATLTCPQTPTCVASAVVLQVTFSAPVTGITATPLANCTQGPAPITCSFPSLAQGATQAVTLQFAAPLVRRLDATVNVSSNDGEQQASDNVVTDPINIRLRPWLRVPLKLP